MIVASRTVAPPAAPINNLGTTIVEFGFSRTFQGGMKLHESGKNIVSHRFFVPER
jgi:hypothetical protein